MNCVFISSSNNILVCYSYGVHTSTHTLKYMDNIQCIDIPYLYNENFESYIEIYMLHRVNNLSVQQLK